MQSDLSDMEIKGLFTNKRLSEVDHLILEIRNINLISPSKSGS